MIEEDDTIFVSNYYFLKINPLSRQKETWIKKNMETGKGKYLKNTLFCKKNILEDRNWFGLNKTERNKQIRLGSTSIRTL